MNIIDLLLELGIQPKRTAMTKGGEYHSPCPDPTCRGKDRFCIWPEEDDNGRFWCRRCEKSGDAIQFCRDFLGLDFSSACEKIGKKPKTSFRERPKSVIKKFISPASQEPCVTWMNKAKTLLQICHCQLLNAPHIIDQEKKRGLNSQSVSAFQLGWNSHDLFEKKEAWGLQINHDTKIAQNLCIPKGIVIPSFRLGKLIRIKIRRQGWNPNDKYPKYQIIPGSMICPAIYGDETKPLILVEAELDAILIQQIAGDLCCCVALGGVTNRPDHFTDLILKKASRILFSLDYDDAGRGAFKYWRNSYSNLKPWPVPKGKSPGDAFSFGVDLREWIVAGIKR